jgi:hypothetical protein
MNRRMLNRSPFHGNRNAPNVELHLRDRYPKPERRADDSLTNDVFCAAFLAPEPVRDIDPTLANEKTLDGRSGRCNDDDDTPGKYLAAMGHASMRPTLDKPDVPRGPKHNAVNVKRASMFIRLDVATACDASATEAICMRRCDKYLPPVVCRHPEVWIA